MRGLQVEVRTLANHSLQPTAPSLRSGRLAMTNGLTVTGFGVFVSDSPS